MSLSDVSIRNPVFAWMLMVALLLFGGLCFKRMGVSQLPDVDLPVVTISVNLDGAAPEIMELDVVEPIEDAIQSVQGIETISSNSRMGSASVTVEFKLNKNIDVAVQEIESALARTLQTLPTGTEAPVVRKSNPEDQPILWLSASSKTMKPAALMSFVNDRLKNRFSTIDGVADIDLSGYIEPALRVWASREKLAAFDLAVTDIINTIHDEHSEVPAGRLQNKEQESNIRTLGEAKSPEEFGKLTINRRGGGPNFRPIPLHQVTRLEDGLQDIRRLSRANGQPAVGLAIRKSRGANAVAVATRVRERLKEVQAQLPEGVELGIRFDSTTFIQEAVHELNFTLVLSGLLTALVCWLFLGSLSATINVIMAIPTSVVGSFIVLYALGFTLNTFTLLGLSLAIGIVVDDAIMVLENIVRHYEMGKRRRQAALDGAREVTFAALAATIAITAIFLPVAFMEGLIGKYFFQFGVTISVAVALSLLEALTLTPMRSAEYLSVEKRTSWIGRGVEKSFHWSEQAYKRLVLFVLQHRVATVLLSLAFFGLSYSVERQLGKEFTPAQDQSRLMVRVQTPEGSSLEKTNSKMLEIEQVLAQHPEVDTTFVSVGGGGGSNDANSGMIFLTLKDPKSRPIPEGKHKALSQQQIAHVLRQEFKSLKGVRALVMDPSLSFGGSRGYPVELTVKGPEWPTLIASSQKLMDALRASGLLSDVDSNYRGGMPEVNIVPNREAARQYGVNIFDIGQAVSALMGGKVAGQFSRGGHRYDVRVQIEDSERRQPEDILGIKVRNNRGELVKLSKLVTITHRETLQAISREGGERAVRVTANLAPGVDQARAIEAVMKSASETLPQDYYVTTSGSAKTFKESFNSLVLALALGLLISYMVLASQFNSFIHPITVLVALPFSVSGAFLTLWAGGQTLNVYSMIGLILLMGIVKKNSILLVDFTNQVRATGKNVHDSLVEACPLRLRPILMTSIATIVGAVPAALAFGPGAESRVPMALAVVGGTFVSTLLTLFVVPCVYSLLSNLERPSHIE